MINTSTEYKQAVAEKKRFIAKATCLLKNGTTLEFNQSNLMVGGVLTADGVTSSNNFDIGAAIINQLTLAIYNGNDEFSDYDFTDAVITVWVGMPLSDRIEWLKKGVFNASDPTTTPDVISLKAWDNMSKFDTAYDGGLSFPTTIQTIVQHCCTRCGILLVNGQFPNYNYRIEKDPFGENGITYRAIIAYCALLAGCFARCNVDGRLELKWYDTAAFNGIIDGGVFDKTTESSYQTGDNLDGGNFTDYNSGDTADGGTFTEDMPYHHIYSFSSLSVSTEDVVITGIRVKASDGEDSSGQKVEGETYLCGAEGYILEVSGNPLIEPGKAKAVAEYLAGRVVGMRFRPFTASAIGDPSWEAGDAAMITDRKGNSYYTYLTNVTYSTGGYANISCDAEPAARHSADRYEEINKIVSDIKKDSQQQLTEYGKLLEQMNGLAVNAMGYYETTVVGDDGSKIHYMHDKPLLSDSKIVYKQSIDGFFWSKDGGKTWTGGVDKDGNAVMNVIAAIGISSEWIDTRGFKAADDDGNVTFEIDAKTGKVRIEAESFSLSGKTIQDIADGAVDGLDESLTFEEVFNRLTNNGTMKGLYIKDGQLYFSFNYAKGGNLSLGGKDNGNGVLKILNSSGVEIGTWDNTGAHLYQGEIKGPLIKVGGSGNKYGALEVIGDDDILRMKASGNIFRFYDKSGAEVGAITCDNLISGGFEHSIIIGLSNLTSNILFSDDGVIETHAKKGVNMAQSKVQFNGDSTGGVFIHAVPQTTTSSWDAKFIESSGGLYSDYNFKLVRGVSSSERYKDVGKEMTAEDIEQLYNITPVWAKYKEGYLEESDERYGVEHPMFIAENIDKYAPLAADHDKDGRPENWNQRVMMPYMFQMLKEQKNELDNLKARLKEMEEKVHVN